jgi:hypothetical protein
VSVHVNQLLTTQEAVPTRVLNRSLLAHGDSSNAVCWCAVAPTHDGMCSADSDGTCTANFCGAFMDWVNCQETTANTMPASCPSGASLSMMSVPLQSLGTKDPAIYEAPAL